MSESGYIPLERRAERLIEKGIRAWQRIQQTAMEEDELIDSVVLIGQSLWLPHHETDGTLYGVTLRITVHYPAENNEARFTRLLREIEESLSDEQGHVRIRAESPSAAG